VRFPPAGRRIGPGVLRARLLGKGSFGAGPQLLERQQGLRLSSRLHAIALNVVEPHTCRYRHGGLVNQQESPCSTPHRAEHPVRQRHHASRIEVNPSTKSAAQFLVGPCWSRTAHIGHDQPLPATGFEQLQEQAMNSQLSFLLGFSPPRLQLAAGAFRIQRASKRRIGAKSGSSDSPRGAPSSERESR